MSGVLDALLGQVPRPRGGVAEALLGPERSPLDAKPMYTPPAPAELRNAPANAFPPSPDTFGQWAMAEYENPGPGTRIAGGIDSGGLAGVTRRVANGIRAYHGSPHSFDRFDLSRIGTGEGAQAYGHGLYFAGNEGVAREYRDALKTKGLANSTTPMTDAQRIAGELYDSWRGDLHGALDDARFYDNSRDVIAALRKIGANPPTGHMYEVNLNTTPDRLLDWDKPLSQQPQGVREAVQSIDQAARRADYERRGLPPDLIAEYLGNAQARDMAGGNVVRGLANNGADMAAASDQLRRAGIDGIQYLDAGSRAAGQGSRNYVIFDDKLIDILRRYGIAGVLSSGAAGAALSDPQQGNP